MKSRSELILKEMQQKLLKKLPLQNNASKEELISTKALKLCNLYCRLKNLPATTHSRVVRVLHQNYTCFTL